jgi:UPF0716 protein FxsA
MAAEIAGFVVVGREIGALPTVGLVFVTAIVGLSLMRVQGFGILMRIQQDIDAGRGPGRELAHGAMILLAGTLLMVPGFLTDVMGLLLFFPPVRDFGWSLVRSRIAHAGGSGFRWTGKYYRKNDPRTIDLATEEYSRDARRDKPRRRLDRD